jgi:hypothetical protein
MQNRLFAGTLFAPALALARACVGEAATVVADEVRDTQTEFGAAAIRNAAAAIDIGRVTISVSRDLKPEAFRIQKTRGGYAVTGGDSRGAMYGALDLAEQLELTGRAPREKAAQPSLPVRALKFNIPLPGTGYLSAEDLANNQWFWDLGYWQKFLDMAARNRYNTLTFWSAHPAREAKPFGPDSIDHLEGLHDWLQYTCALLRRSARLAPPAPPALELGSACR